MHGAKRQCGPTEPGKVHSRTPQALLILERARPFSFVHVLTGHVVETRHVPRERTFCGLLVVTTAALVTASQVPARPTRQHSSATI